MEVRFPSLSVNTHRRFCYVQFLTAEQAQAATELDGMPTEHDLKLIAKISDPSIRQDRHASTLSGRELFVGNLEFSATDDELNEVFQKYGRIERIRMPRGNGTNNRGIAFILFSNSDEANAATEMDKKLFKSRPLKVSHSGSEKPEASKKFTATIINKAGSPGANSIGSPMLGVEAGSPESTTQDAAHHQSHYRERSIALVQVPDTVNDARIRVVVEAYGPLEKITLRPDHQGAIIVFENVADAGKASIGLQNYEIIPGRHIKVDSVRQMLRLGPEKRSTAKDKSTTLAPSSTIVRRPGAGNARHGNRGGLGFKREARPAEQSKADGTESGEEAQGAKTQDDFRALLKKD